MQAARKVDTTPQQVHDFYVSRGWSSAQAWGIAGNVKQESGFASNALNRNDQETSYGLFQFNSKGNPGAYREFEARYGKPLTQANPYEQMDFVDYQLRTSEKKAGDKLRSATTPAEAAGVFGRYFERPEVVEASRGQYAEEFAAGRGKIVTASSSKVDFATCGLDPTCYGANAGNTARQWVRSGLGMEDDTATNPAVQESGGWLSDPFGMRVLVGVGGAVVLAIGLVKLKV